MPVPQEELRRLATQIMLAYIRGSNDMRDGFALLYTAIYKSLEACVQPKPEPPSPPVKRGRGRPRKVRPGSPQR